MTAAPFVIVSTVLSGLIHLIYIISYIIRNGLPASISASYYKLRHHVFFTLVLWTAACLTVPGIVAISRLHTMWLGYVAVLGLIIVGAAPRFRSKHQRTIHQTGAGLTMAGTTLWVAFNYPLMLTAWSFFAILESVRLILTIKNGNRTCPRKLTAVFVAEITTLITYYASFFIKIAIISRM